jgi:EAL domain-containing protein (putative c-di-GMP-specific phosphodiesterase class I)
VYYQPQIRAGSYEIYGVEALLRYNSDTRGRIFPDEFIPLLEESRLIKVVGLWVLRQSLNQCKKWRESLPTLHVSVNFSALQFEDVFLAEKVVETLREVGLTGEALTVEITESVEIHSSEQILNTMKYLKEYDVKFAIDDFGTGYSNLGYLKQMNVDEIKIDRVFVSGVEKDTYNHKLISNVIEFAKGNDIRTCCEGVESTRELVTLELLLPDIIQGYLFDKPNTAEIIENTYMNSSSKEFIQRTEFIQKIYELKEKMGVIHFEPKDILRENGVGLWVLRLNQEENHYELHVDETMERLMAVGMKYTPRECFAHWSTNIHPDYQDYVQENIEKMIRDGKAVQIEFTWIHPQLGDVRVRFSGKRVNNSDGMIVLEGYYRIITDVIGA